jgi:tetratricopeptide (TPR) repeat protein/predicted Ser/Thr protein kinase
MVPKNPIRSDNKDLSASGGKNPAGSRPPGEQPNPDSPTLVDAGLVSDADSPTSVDLGGSLGPTAEKVAVRTRNSQPYPAQFGLTLGMLVAGRYEILEVLGEGGMGAVYKAKDRELDRLVALKVIRPELATNPDILQRFKQEILLSSKVTHRNVVRIYDLGDAEGFKFITMEYVEGEDLRHALKRHGKLGVNDAVGIIEQLFSGLEAAHREGIIHRDLKPGNIMLDASGRVVVMDFGLARAIASDGMTQTGLMVGTMEYMSPEQAQAKDLDERSDIFTVGLIFYELLTGKMPYQADSAVASLLKRTQERAAPVSSHDAAIPGSLSSIVAKCLEPDPKLRYQNTAEVLADLDNWRGKGAAATLHFPDVQPWARQIPWPLIAVLATVLVLAVTGFLLRNRLVAPRTPTVSSAAAVSVLVADFQNNTSDTLFDGTLEPMFNVALEGASFINAYNRGDAHRLAGKLPNPTDKLDEPTARLVAASQGVSAIVTGALSNSGGGYKLSVEAVDVVTGKNLAKADVSAATKDEVLLDIPKLAVPIRKALGDTTPESVQLTATQGTFAASNVEAVHQWSTGMQQQFAGRWEDALQSFSKAAELDPNFARAYAGMAAAAGNLGQVENAEKYAKLAMEHVDRMTERERYRVRGLYYIRTENWQKCVEEYSELMKQYPADNVGQNNLAFCYAFLLNMPKAMEEAQRGLQLAPKDVMAHMNFALYACYAGNFQSCERGAGEVLKLNPAYEEAFLALAYAQLGQNQLPQAAETYQKLEKVSAWGASLAASGMGGLALYQAKLQEAIQILEKGAAADLAAKNPDAAADKFVMLAEARVLQGEKPSARAAAESALANSQSVKIRFLAARAFVEAGEIAKARKLAASLTPGLQTAPHAYAKLILGETALKEHNPQQAIQLFTEAKDLLDTWVGRFDLGRAYLEAGAFAEADSEFDRCIKRRGEALELFMDDMPTYSDLPPVYYYQGRVREGLNSPGFADSYHTYLSIRGTSTEDPLLPDIRRRLGR